MNIKRPVEVSYKKSEVDKLPTNKESYLFGNLVIDKEMKKIAIQRKKTYKEETIPGELEEKYLKEGWKVKRKLKKKLKIIKEKSCGELFEDEVWLLFKNMGFIEMNKDRNLEIQAGPIRKQIDVFARDEKNVFIVECKALSEENPRSLRQDIHEILNLKKDIIESIRKNYEKDFRFSFLLVTKNIRWSLVDEEFANASRNKDFFFWKETELEAYTNLTNQLGENARFQMYSILFFGKKISELGEIEVPAIYGGQGENKYYSFIIQPEKLLRIAYVHRREESSPEEVSGTYQRIVKKTRLKEICTFINNGGFFPNNIILNFTQKPTFERKDKVGDIVYGVLKFPPYYGSAWVIDGQHRLYGYLKTEKKETANLPVVAFESLSVKNQANLFVEINKKQEKVSSNLLWDLYPDIYRDSEDPEQQSLRAISLIVKKLNSELDSPLHQHINLPSFPKENTKVTNLTLANICDGIKDNKLIKTEERLLYKNDYESTVDFAYERLKVYFNFIANSFPQDWEKGDKGFLRTNIGIRIFLNILRQLLRYLNYEGLKKIYEKEKLNGLERKTEEIVGSILTKLKDMPDTERDAIRSGTGKGKVMENTQRLVWDLKEKFNFGLELWRKGGWSPPIPSEESDERIKEMIPNTENQVRSFIIEKLRKTHGKRWYVEGIPEGVKQTIKEKIEQEINRFPFKREKIQSYSEEKKLTIYSSTADLKEIIKKKNNWEKLSEIFRDQEYTSSQFKSLEVIRNAYVGHEQRKEELDKIEKNLGYWGMKWIRRCVGLDK